jgi:hypothetical protein
MVGLSLLKRPDKLSHWRDFVCHTADRHNVSAGKQVLKGATRYTGATIASGAYGAAVTLIVTGAVRPKSEHRAFSGFRWRGMGRLCLSSRHGYCPPAQRYSRLNQHNKRDCPCQGPKTLTYRCIPLLTRGCFVSKNAENIWRGGKVHAA